MSISSIIDQICKLYCRKLNYLLIIIYPFFLLSLYSLTFQYQISKVNYNHHNRHIFQRSSSNKMYSKYMTYSTKMMMNAMYIKGYIHTSSTICSRLIYSNNNYNYNCYQYAIKKIFTHSSQSKSRLSMKIGDTLLTTTIHVDNKVKVVNSIRSSSTSGSIDSSASTSSSNIGNSFTMTKNRMRKEWKKMLIQFHNDNSYGIITDKPKGGWYTIDRFVMDLDDKVFNRNDDDDDKVLNRNDDDEVSMDDDSRGIMSLMFIHS